jgi:hypothetical protein
MSQLQRHENVDLAQILISKQKFQASRAGGEGV